MIDATPRDRRTARYAWREAGPTSGVPTVVLLHGLGGSRISWEPQLAGLAGWCRVVAWDLPGYGDAPVLGAGAGAAADRTRSRAGDREAPMTFRLLAHAVIGLADELGVAQVHLAGISFGGMIAQYVAALHGDRLASLTLLSTSPKFGLDGTAPDAWRAARLASLDAGRQPADFAADVLSHLAGPDISPAAMCGQLAAMSRITAGALRRSIDCLITHDSRPLLPQIRVPTLCLVGALDDETPIAYSQYLAEHIPGARLHIVAGAGHLLNAEAPDPVNELLLAHVLAHSAHPAHPAHPASPVQIPPHTTAPRPA